MNDSAATPGEAREASRAADDFRAALERRREAEDLLAEARAARQEAMAEAIEIVRVAESMARVIEDAARASAQSTVAEAELEHARREIQALQERALAEVAAQQRNAEAAFHDQVGATIARLEAMATEVQMVLDRAMTDLTGSLSPLAEAPVSWTVDPPSANGDAATPSESWHERWRKAFRPPH